MNYRYEFILLSDLYKKSRRKVHPDFIHAMDYIYRRLEQMASSPSSSQFYSKIRWIYKIVPLSVLIKLLYHLRYDAMIAFREDESGRKIYGMISFQKHPAKSRIGMFDIYVSPEYRDKDLVGNFQKLAYLVYQLTLSFQKSGYQYLQCGKNETTRKLLRLYERLCQKNQWDSRISIEKSRIYLS